MELIVVALKALAGGTLVVGFSALGDVLKPKAFAGGDEKGPRRSRPRLEQREDSAGRPQRSVRAFLSDLQVVRVFHRFAHR